MPSLLSLRLNDLFGNKELTYDRKTYSKKEQEAFINSIITQESGGDYSAISKPSRKGQKAYGKYQIMDFNIPVWTKEVLGRAYTPKEFLADQQAQDAVARKRLSDLYQRYGAKDAASYWFSGGPLSKNAENTDVTGKKVKDYAREVVGRMNELMGGGTAYADTTVKQQKVPSLLDVRLKEISLGTDDSTTRKNAILATQPL